MKNFLQFGPFTGVVASLDAEMIPDNAAADLRNVLVEDGKIRPRYGYRVWSGAPAGFQGNFGFDYVQGFDANKNLAEEYVSFELRNGVLFPYSVNVTTGARTQLTNLGASVALTPPTYGDQPGIRAVSFNNFAYCISPNDTVSLYKHSVGTIGSFLPMSPPLAPSMAPAIQIQPYMVDGSAPSLMRWDDGQYSFVVSPATATAGAVYSNNGQTFTVATSISGGASLVAVGSGPPSTSGTLTKVSGTGDASIVFSSFASPVLAGSAVGLGGPFSLVDGSPLTSNGALNLVLVKDPGPAGLSGGTVTVALTGTHGPGAQDFTYVDRIVIPVSSPPTAVSGSGMGEVNFDGNYFTVTLTSASGQSFTPTTLTPILYPASLPTQNWQLVCDFGSKLPRSDWSSIASIQIGFGIYNFPDTAPPGGNVNLPFSVGQVTLGQVDTQGYDDAGNPVNLILGYTYYSTTTGLESPISPTVTLKPALLEAGGIKDPYTNKLYSLHSRAKIFLTVDAGVPQDCDFRLYARRVGDSQWYLVYDPGLAASVPVGGLIKQNTFDQRVNAQGRKFGDTGASPTKVLNGVTYNTTTSLRISWAELALSSSFALGLGSPPFKNLICACPFKGWMVWGFKGGQSNLQHSAIGNELTLYSTADLTALNPSNLSAPANFTLADNGSDDPVAMFPVAASLVILGSHGVYAQTGYSPTTMSPPWRLPTALGCLGQYACCLWHDDMMGNPGVAFVSKNGEGVYMVQEDLTYTSQTHFKVTELTVAVRGLLQSFLGPNLSGLRMGVDWTKDALWVICGSRAMVLRRPSLADQQRHWELYQWSLGGGVVSNISFETKWRMRWARSSGQLDENEWSSLSSTYITGLGSDGGLAISPCYFVTKKMTSPAVSRVSHVEVDREVLTDTPSVTAASTRQSTTLVCPSGRYNLRFGQHQQGREHQFTLVLPDGCAGVRRLLVETFGPLGDRWRS